MSPITLLVEYIPIITDITKVKSEKIILNDPTIKGLLDQLCDKYGKEMFDLFWQKGRTCQRNKFVLTIVNGDLVHKTEHQLYEEDKILIMPALSGG
ncbi:MAG: hypothetical protein JM58_00935 [Peptococcaceae bacterium BICA1-8]|nr:MAG: hypothetical protein JM58_00935 [Peptococcaceae bacterium BICA1-8]